MSATRGSRGRGLDLLFFALAVVGALGGIALFFSHLASDPLADARAYYDAGARLNAGEPLCSPEPDRGRSKGTLP